MLSPPKIHMVLTILSCCEYLNRTKLLKLSEQERSLTRSQSSYKLTITVTTVTLPISSTCKSSGHIPANLLQPPLPFHSPDLVPSLIHLAGTRGRHSGWSPTSSLSPQSHHSAQSTSRLPGPRGLLQPEGCGSIMEFLQDL